MGKPSINNDSTTRKSIHKKTLSSIIQVSNPPLRKHKLRSGDTRGSIRKQTKIWKYKRLHKQTNSDLEVQVAP
jgi:hypothetical protein